jgi:hypothetical protein
MTTKTKTTTTSTTTTHRDKKKYLINDGWLLLDKTVLKVEKKTCLPYDRRDGRGRSFI